MSIYGSTDDWADSPKVYWSKNTESQSIEPSDHVDDKGNTPPVWKPASAVSSTDEWAVIPLPQRDENWLKKTDPVVRKGGRNPYIGTEQEQLPKIEAPAFIKLPGIVKPKAAQPEPAGDVSPPGKSVWDKITPGSSTTPGEFFDQLKIPDVTEFDVIPGKKEFKPFSVPGDILGGVKGLGDMLPILMIAMIMKD